MIFCNSYVIDIENRARFALLNLAEIAVPSKPKLFQVQLRDSGFICILITTACPKIALQSLRAVLK